MVIPTDADVPLDKRSPRSIPTHTHTSTTHTSTTPTNTISFRSLEKNTPDWY